MNRSEILQLADRYVSQDRATTHGSAENNFTELGKIWGCRLGVDLHPSQVAIMLLDLKTVRAWDNLANEDNWVDMAGYASCGGEIATKID
jgi:hypothetical protein